MYYHTTRNPNLDPNPDNDTRLYRLKLTLRLLSAAIKAVLDPHTIRFEFDKRADRVPDHLR